VIETLVTEINRNYCLNLADDIIVARGGGLANMGISAGNIAMIGASHTRRISDSSAASRIKIIKGLPRWTSDENAVTEISSALSLAGLSEKDCVYFDLFSNTTFLGTDERGLPAEPEQDKEGAWHLRGTLDVAPVRSLQRIARMAVDLVAAAGAATVIMGLPLARYVAMPCCNDESHVENYGARDFETTLRAGVAAVREALESALLGSNKTVIYLDPHTVFGGETLRDLAASGGESIWCEDDGVHLTQAACADLMAAIIGLWQPPTTASRRRIASVVPDAVPRQHGPARGTPRDGSAQSRGSFRGRAGYYGGGGNVRGGRGTGYHGVNPNRRFSPY
jgi:hypothetical protein